ncbi:hypothetical protein SAMN05216249_10280 [Acetitomaculum ruminis DSM 5522]|uniref:Uncharacterized protein n=1 Tax=Acetitomaculum ruminis DSM 5522 TaxID=1120918 RepID=A0A1I0VN43_9FIRM|nr:hypothetical protein [Acetitomaculum ruminis]SFA77280.1 hypothetical protein SAMN05216249_10280 [Acetitomaculum ruminis DSM 5522]
MLETSERGNVHADIQKKSFKGNNNNGGNRERKFRDKDGSTHVNKKNQVGQDSKKRSGDFKNQNNGDAGFRKNNFRKKGDNDDYKGRSSSYRGRDNGDYKKDGDFNNRGFRKDEGRGNNKENNYSRNNSKTNENKREIDKFKEQQPDKMEIINRLQKEKKAIQKKNQDNKRKSKSASSRPTPRKKRINNIDWTKEYENDSYDDDDAYYDY